MKIKIKKKPTINVEVLPPGTTSRIDETKASIAANNKLSDFKKYKNQSIVERLKVLDPAFGDVVNKMEQHWLFESNAILKEIINRIRVLISDPDTTMTDLVKALDKIAEKAQLAQGLPTSFSASMSIGLGSNPTALPDTTLDSRIKQIEDHLSFSSKSRKMLN